jgi:uncharacterized protein YjiS (DUF1127 family)
LRDIVTAFRRRKRQNCAGDHIRLDREKAGWHSDNWGMEAAMKISTEAALFGTHHTSRWSGLNHVLTDWWETARLRRELQSLDDCILRDIGLTRGEERFEASKPYWMN